MAIFVVILPVFYASAFDNHKVQSKTKVRKFLNVIGTIEENRIEFETYNPYDGDYLMSATFHAGTDYLIDNGDVDTYNWRLEDRSYGFVPDPFYSGQYMGCYQFSWGEIYIISDDTQYLHVTSIIEGWKNGGYSDDDNLTKYGSTWGWWNLATSSSTW